MAVSKKPPDPADPSEKPKVDLTAHRLVTHLNPEGDASSDLVVLIGFIGPSRKVDWTRLYLSLSFNTFIDIPSSGIISTQPVDGQDENSPTRVWVRGETRLDVVQTVSQTMEASYLRGGIAREYLTSTMPVGMLMVRDPNATINCLAQADDYTLARSFCLTCRPPASGSPWLCPK